MAVVLEGGYNLESISESMTMCTRSLLGDPPPPLGRLRAPHPSALQSLAHVAAVHRKYWASLRLKVPAVLREKPRTRAGRGTPIPDEIPRENCSELITTPTVQPVEATADKAENSTPQPAETLANMVAKSVSPQPMQVQVVVITTPTAQPVETVDDAVMAMGSLQLEDNPVEESETASSSLSPDSSPVGGVRQNSSSSPDKVEPAENIKGGSMSTESSSGEAESSDKEAEVSPQDLPPSPTEMTLRDEATGGCSASCELLGVDLKDTGLFYAVTPLSWCPHLDSVLPVPLTGFDVLEPCAECGSHDENWVCLICYKVACGRYINQHMVAHNSKTGHPLVLSFEDLSVWCYECQAYVHHPILFEAKCHAHKMKFGEDLVIPY